MCLCGLLITSCKIVCPYILSLGHMCDAECAETIIASLKFLHIYAHTIIWNHLHQFKQFAKKIMCSCWKVIIHSISQMWASNSECKCVRVDHVFLAPFKTSKPSSMMYHPCHENCPFSFHDPSVHHFFILDFCTRVSSSTCHMIVFFCGMPLYVLYSIMLILSVLITLCLRDLCRRCYLV